MSTYIIDFSEPLTAGFPISPGSYNGPGMNSPETSLRLYGRGAIEWGEGVNEDLVRLVENFASATPPANPVNGQLWAETKLYHYDGVNYWHFDPNVLGGPWTLLSPQPTTTIPSNPTLDSSYYIGTGADAGKLFGYHTQKPDTLTDWIVRSFSTGPLNSVTDKPEVVIKAYNAFTGEWTQPLPVVVSTTPNAPTTPTTGTIWYDTLTNILSIWDGAAWQSIMMGSTASGNIDMGTNQITFANMFLNEGDGDTSTGADIRFNHAGLLTSADNLHIIVDNDNNATGNFVLSKGALNTTSDIELLTVYNNGEVRSNVADYDLLVTNPNTLTNKQYVDDAVASVSGSIPSVSSLVQTFVSGSTASHKPGDMYINTATARIWVAVTTATSMPTNYATDGSDANWKQVFPALYA